MSPQKHIFRTLIFTAIGCAGLFSFLSFNHEVNRPKLPIIGQVKSFQLIDENETPFYSQSLDNRVWIVNFFFTTCQDICPMMSQNMAELNRTFEKMPAIHLVSISVNPETDTPQKLTEYAAQFKGSRNKWHFLTGTREDITPIVVDSFKLGSIEEPIFHSSYFTLVDRHGYIRGYYDGTKTKEINQLFKDAAKLLRDR